MNEIEYSALILMPQVSELSFEKLRQKIISFFNKKSFPEVDINIFDKDVQFGKVQLCLKKNDWSIDISYNNEPYVLEEAIEISEKYSSEDSDRQLFLEKCNSRFEIYSNPDPNMDYFNYYMWILGIFSEYEGVIIFDPQSTCFV
jgi:hypothetical protein